MIAIDKLLIVGLAALAAALPSSALAQRDCRRAATLEVYAFLAARPLTAPETMLVRREVAQHADEAQPNDCANSRKIHAAIVTRDPVMRERVRVAMHRAIWFDPATGAARRAILQRIAPIVVADDRRKLLVRRRAIEAYLASVRFVAGKIGMAAPADTVEANAADIKAGFARVSDTVKHMAADQEAYLALLKRDWAKKGAAWQKRALGRRPTDDKSLRIATGKVQLALAEGGGSAHAGGRRYPWQSRLDRYNAAMNRGLVSGAVLGAMAAGRP